MPDCVEPGETILLQYGPRCINLPSPHDSQQVKVTNVRDLTIGYEESTPDHKPVSNISCTVYITVPVLVCWANKISASHFSFTMQVTVENLVNLTIHQSFCNYPFLFIILPNQFVKFYAWSICQIRLTFALYSILVLSIC